MPGATCPTPKVNTHPRTLSPQQHSQRSSADRLAVNSHSRVHTVSLTLPISLSLLGDLRGMHRHSVCVWRACTYHRKCKCTYVPYIHDGRSLTFFIPRLPIPSAHKTRFYGATEIGPTHYVAPIAIEKGRFLRHRNYAHAFRSL